MDNLTHAITGLMLSRAGLDRWCPRAALILVIAANAPDIDIAAVVGGPAAYLDHHRGATHGLAMLPVVALLPVLIVGLLRRTGFRWGRAWLVSLIGVASHLLLDLTNIYGIRLLAPFSNRWFALEITSVFDAWIWGVGLLAVGWPLLARLVNAEIGARTSPGRGMAVFFLSFLLLYDGARFLLRQRAVATLEAHLHGGGTPMRAAALPGSMNPFRWTGVVETRGLYMLHRMNLRSGFDPTAGVRYFKPAHSPEMEMARRTPAFETLLRFSRYPLWRQIVEPLPEGGVKVQAMDLRFGIPWEGRFTATAILDANRRVVRSWYQFEDPGAPPRFR